MTTKAELHQLIDALPENQTEEAARRLAGLQDMEQLAATLKARLSFEQLCQLVAWLQEGFTPLERSLLTAPWDDEPETDEERAAVAEARAEFDRGEWLTTEEVRRELGL